METSNASGIPKAWLLFGLSTAGMLIFAALYFSTPKTPTGVPAMTDTLTKRVTNNHLIESPKVIERIQIIPASLPQSYGTAMRFLQKITNASSIKNPDRLFAMKDVKINITFSDDLKKVLTENETRAKFELTLRKNNVPINPDSANTIFLEIEFMNGDVPYEGLYFYTFHLRVYETQIISRDGEFHKSVVCVYDTAGSLGYAGKSKVHDVLLNLVGSAGEIFANDFLSSNTKAKQLQRDIDFAEAESEHWQQQIENIRLNREWFAIKGFDRMGIPILGESKAPSPADALSTQEWLDTCLKVIREKKEQLRQLTQ